MRPLWTSLALLLASLLHVEGYTCPSGKSKETITLAVGESVDFSTQDTETYGKNVKCVVKFKRGKRSKCKLNFSCSAFTLTAKNSNCNKGSDFVKIGKEKFCEDNSPDVTVNGRTLNVLFRSNKRSKGGEGAECTATCIDNEEVSTTTPAASTEAPTTTPSPATTAAPTTGEPLVEGLCSTKLGVGLNPDTWSDPSNPSFLCNDLAALGELAWWYDWGIADIHGWSGPAYSCPGGRGPPGFVPILRKHEYTSAEALPDIEADTILGFNEPNHPSQDNMSPEETALEWIAIQERFPDKTLVSPSAAPCGGNCNGGDTKDWFRSFFSNCTALRGCRVDFLNTHVYSCDVDYVMTFLQELYDEFGLRIWLTEVACPFAREADEIKAFMAELLPRLEAADHVARYAWFATRFPTQDWGQYWYLSSENSLLEANLSARTPLGDLYMTSACPSTA